MKPEGAASSRRPAAALLLAVLALAAGGLAVFRLARTGASLPTENLRSLVVAAGLPDCDAPVSVAWPVDQERLGCAVDLPELLALAIEGSGCLPDAEADAGAVPRPSAGERLRLTRAEDGRCLGTLEMLPGSALLALGLPIDLNRASALDLEALEEIGPHRARAVIADREARGAFPSVEALTRVSGIGPATLAAVRSKLTVAKPAVTGEDEGLLEVVPVEGTKR